MEEVNVVEVTTSEYYITGLIVFALFQFVNTYLMNFFKPGNLLMLSAMLGVVATFLVIMGSGMLGVIALIAIS